MMYKTSKVMNNEYVTFLTYVRNELSDYTAEIAVALKNMDKYRCPLDDIICDKIWGCFDDFITDYDLDRDTNMEEYFDKDVEEIFFDAIDYEIK